MFDLCIETGARPTGRPPLQQSGSNEKLIKFPGNVASLEERVHVLEISKEV